MPKSITTRTNINKINSTIRIPKVGIILANLGTPSGTNYWSIRRYLSQFLSDSRVIDYPKWRWQPILQLIILSKRPFRSGKAYQKIWNNELNESPLLTITRQQCKKLRHVLELKYSNNIIIDFAMRYGQPSIASVVQNMHKNGAEKIIFFPLYPQYAGATTATANDDFFRSLISLKHQPSICTIAPYFDHPDYIKALINKVKTTYKTLAKKPDLLVLSYHGLPKRYIEEGDPYYKHCLETSRLVKEGLNWEDTDIISTFQSKFGPTEWLQPYTVKKVAELAKSGKKNIAIMAPGFSSDCIETLEEIEDEIRDSFIASGGKNFTYIPCLNDDDDHINMMLKIIETELS